MGRRGLAADTRAGEGGEEGVQGKEEEKEEREVKAKREGKGVEDDIP